MTKPDWKAYEEYAKKTLKKAKTPGAVVSIALDGKPIYTGGFGYRDIDRKIQPDSGTVFGIGSVTKSFTAVAVMQLQEQGKLRVDDCILKYIPEFRYGKTGIEKGITIHHLLSHTAGLPPLPLLMRVLGRSLLRDAEEDAEFAPSKGKGGREALIAQIRSLTPIDDYPQLLEALEGIDTPPVGLPGQQFSYSNEGYALLGLVIERVSGMKYEDYIAGHIFEPLGMSHSSFDSYKSDNVAVLYASERIGGKQEVYPSPHPWEAPSMTAAGFIRSNADDMQKYMEIFRTGGLYNDLRVLSQKSVDQMTSPYGRSANGSGYGYGLSIHPNYKGVSLVEHDGGAKGISAHVTCVREKGITCVVLCNLHGSPSGSLVLGAVNTVLGIPVGTRRYSYPDFQMDPARLHRYAGKYASGEGQAFEVRPENGKLIFESGGSRIPARPIGVDAFAVGKRGSEAAARFLTGPSGEVTAVQYSSRIIFKVDSLVT